jgi:hypothetical protein
VGLLGNADEVTTSIIYPASFPGALSRCTDAYRSASSAFF